MEWLAFAWLTFGWEALVVLWVSYQLWRMHQLTRSLLEQEKALRALMVGLASPLGTDTGDGGPASTQGRRHSSEER